MFMFIRPVFSLEDVHHLFMHLIDHCIALHCIAVQCNAMHDHSPVGTYQHCVEEPVWFTYVILLVGVSQTVSQMTFQ